MNESMVEFWKKGKAGEPWDVKRAEKDIYKMHRRAVLSELNTPAIIMEAEGAYGIEGPTMDANRERIEFEKNKDNDLGFHLNHIVSERKKYWVFEESYECYTLESEHETEESAMAHAKEFDAKCKAYVEEYPKGKYSVWVLNEEQTQYMQEHTESVRSFVDEFDTLEEAEREAAKYEYSSIEEYPSEEWWTVISNDSGKAVFKIMFPTPERALAFLYKAIQPEAWMKYCEACDHRQGIDISDHLVRRIEVNQEDTDA